MGMPSYCKQTMMYEKDYVTGKVNGPEECISFERPDNCDFHSCCQAPKPTPFGFSSNARDTW